MAYAEKTTVSVERSKAEIETLLMRHGCDAIATMVDMREMKSAVQFRASDRMIRFTLLLPDEEQFAWANHRKRTPANRRKAHDQALRQRWRALLLCIKAKLEAVESGIETFEEAFLAQIMLPDNTTVGQRMIPAVCAAYETGKMPPVGLLTAGSVD